MDPFVNRLTQKGSPFELMDAVINGVPCKIFPHGPKTLQDVFLKTASFKQKEFIVHGNERLSFETVIKQAKQLAVVLQKEYGVGKGDRVALLMSNSPNWVIAFIAIIFSGSTAVIIHADSEKLSVLNALKKTGCSLIINGANNTKKLENNNIKYTAILFSKNFHNEFKCDDNEKNSKLNLSFYNLSKTKENETPPCVHEIPKPSPDDEALISFTSGTTGDPKGVILSHRNMTTGLMNMMLGGFMMSCRAPKRQVNNVNTQPCSLLLSPFSHIGGYSQIMLMAYLGGKIVLMNEWETDDAATLIENEQARTLSGATPAMIRGLLRDERSKKKIKTLSNINVHGSALNPSFLKEVTDDFQSMTLGTGYGMTETCGGISALSGTELLDKPNWIGPVLPSVDLKILDESGNRTQEESLGEIYVRGAMVMKEYCAEQGKTNDVLNDGWLKTGDLGYLDSVGNLFITDRIKDVIICGDKRVSAGELERSVSEYDMVDEAVAFGVSKSERCQTIIVAVQANNKKRFEEKKIKHEIASITKKYCKNIKIVLVGFLPRTSSGKINRNELRKHVLSVL